MKKTRLQTIKAYYEKRYMPNDMGPSRRSVDSFLPFLEWIGITRETRLLDVACGAGAFLACVGEVRRACGIDLSSRAINVAKTVANFASYCVGDMQTLPYEDASFDVIVCIGALEHVPDMRMALSEMARVSVKQGKFCIVVPNENFFWYRVLSLKGTQQVEMEEHLHTLGEWQTMIEAAGIHVLQIERDPGPKIRVNLGIQVFIRDVLRKLALYFATLLPLASTYQFVFICEKR